VNGPCYQKGVMTTWDGTGGVAGTLDALRRRARAWLDDDPDDNDRAELRAVLDALPGSEADLADRFAGPLTFGTAGLRGPLRAGPNGMNLAVVRGAAAGLVRWLDTRGVPGPLVIGYDARHRSAEFARETARVATGAGRRALVMPRPLPTPVLAHAVRALGAAAGVMVTASHNPPRDNGYKVYLGTAAGGPGGGGAQLVPPADAEIEAAIRDVGSLAKVPLGEPGETLGDGIVASYVDGAAAVVDPEYPRDLVVAYTPMHGVGGRVFVDAMAAAGFPPPYVVAEQAEPDPEFPTVSFPNPEEPGATDRVMALATAHSADIAIANDPDADRCAVAVADPAAPGGWRMLRGDEVGVLLADHLMRRGVRGRYATTIVSSLLLEKLCAARGVSYGETLTGFKWIVRAGVPGVPGRAVGPDAPLAYGYEEALGYCVAPDHVRDKDGISAALLVCELAAGLKAELSTLGDRLDEIAAEFGVHATDQVSVRVEDLSEIAVAMRTLRDHPPASLLDEPVTTMDDLLPETDAMVLRTESARIVVRPSGTEPKLKAYLEVVEPTADSDVAAARGRAAAALAALRTETCEALGLL
jgi:phosphomannomutase